MDTFRPDLYRDPDLVAGLAAKIAGKAAQIGRKVKIMHICGTHEHEMGRHGLRGLLPENVEVLAGPGCPVCVCDQLYIDQAIALSQEPGVILASFGDMLAVPGGVPLEGERRGDVRMSLLDARARGGDVRAVYSVFDAVRIAHENPDKEVVFFSVGFETTVVAVAALLLRGAPAELSILEANYYTPPATRLLPSLPGFDIDAFLLPGHAAAVTGIRIYEHLPREHGIACAAAGFEPVDQLAGILAVLRQIAAGEPRLENAYPRVLAEDGNVKAQEKLFRVFELVPKRWRGIGVIPESGFDLLPEFDRWSARERFKGLLPEARREGEHPRGCRCAAVTLGQSKPSECPAFGAMCTPDDPYGPCMVSGEGTCRAWYLYGAGDGSLEVRA